MGVKVDIRSDFQIVGEPDTLFTGEQIGTVLLSGYARDVGRQLRWPAFCSRSAFGRKRVKHRGYAELECALVPLTWTTTKLCGTWL